MTPRDRVSRHAARHGLLIAGILLIAANLRAPVTGIGPLIPAIQDAYGLGNAQAGLLTALPLLAFGSMSPAAALLARRFGLERSLFAALLLVATGIVMRSLGPLWCLFAGTWVIGAGIAAGNVLLPSLLKRDFPTRIAAVTGAYGVTMAVGAAVASAVMVPIAELPGVGWPLALGAMLLLPAAALLCWAPLLRRRTEAATPRPALSRGGGIWLSAIAWQVTLFMGINSFLYYVLIAWLPAILESLGYGAAEAGSIHGLMQLAGVVPGIMLAPIAQRLGDQKGIATGIALLITLCLLGLWLAPGWAALWAVGFGLGSSAGMILSLILIGLRTGNPHQAAALSGMSQCVGYLLAASGPPLIGALHSWVGGWSIPLGLCAALSLFIIGFGLFAGRARQIPTSAARDDEADRKAA